MELRCPFCKWADPFETIEDLYSHITNMNDNVHIASKLWEIE